MENAIICICGHAKRFHKNEFAIIGRKRKEIDTSCTVLGCICPNFVAKEISTGD